MLGKFIQHNRRAPQGERGSGTSEYALCICLLALFSVYGAGLAGTEIDSSLLSIETALHGGGSSSSAEDGVILRNLCGDSTVSDNRYTRSPRCDPSQGHTLPEPTNGRSDQTMSFEGNRGAHP